MKQQFKLSAIVTILVIPMLGILPNILFGQGAPRMEKKNVVVFSEGGRFAGWPANHGAWSWGNELLVGFETGVHKKSKGHAVDYSKPTRHVLARSLDGGETWKVEEPESLRPPYGTRVATLLVVGQDREVTDCPGGVDFSNPDLILTFRMTRAGMNWADPGRSRFYYSLDRGKVWMGPYRLPNFGLSGTAARTDYIINGKHDLTLFLTAAKSDGEEGRVICVRTRDGAKTWELQSFVGPEPKGREEFAIMPSSVRLLDGKIVTAIRYGSNGSNKGLGSEKLGFIDVYGSDDDGKSWTRLSRAASEMGGSGNPPSMVILKDGRLVVTYGYRQQPYGMRARISKDGGKSWGEEIMLRADAGGSDIGYPQTLVRPDGKLVTIYYYNLHVDTERFIGATIWDPGKSQ